MGRGSSAPMEWLSRSGGAPCSLGCPECGPMATRLPSESKSCERMKTLSPLLERMSVSPTGMVKILKSAEAYADAEWEEAEREIAEVGGDPDILPEIYLDAVTWAGERVLLNAS